MPRRYIFIADDDRLMCELIARALGDDGHEAKFAVDGARALAALKGRRPDLLILDANMPVVDGFAVLQALKADPALRTLPVLMLTGRRSEEDVRRAHALGAGAYIVKPFVIPVLLARAYALIASSRPLSQLPATAASPEIFARLDDTEWID